MIHTHTKKIPTNFPTILKTNPASKYRKKNLINLINNENFENFFVSLFVIVIVHHLPIANTKQQMQWIDDYLKWWKKQTFHYHYYYYYYGCGDHGDRRYSFQFNSFKSVNNNNEMKWKKMIIMMRLNSLIWILFLADLFTWKSLPKILDLFFLYNFL